MINSNSRPDSAHAIQNARLMDKAETLEHAKRRAATSFSRMTASFTGDLASETVRDEQDVLRARVDLLNELMRSPDTRLCLEAEGRQPRVCVTYDRARCEGELELGPMQSTMAWAVQGCEDTIQQLLSAADRGGHEPVVKGLLGLVQQSAPAKDVLHGLHRVLSLPPPERMLLKSVAAGTTGEPHTRVIEGLGEARAEDAVPALYRVAWGALDLDVLEGWQNPSTNAAIRLSILDTAHQAAREAQRTKAAAWSNVGYIQARIFHGEECHTLTLRPFWDSESCTVSHLQFKQSVFDDCGPERGLLNLAQDPASIHPIPLGKILPLQAYVCLGAHRKSRLSEVQLNYVHAQGLLAHGFDTRHLPDASTLLDLPAGRMVPAKSTRVSAQKLDVLASSYHVADQVYTTITVVQYPPFGTQFEKRVIDTKSAGIRMPSLGPHMVQMPGIADSDHDDANFDNEQTPDVPEDDNSSISDGSSEETHPRNFTVHNRDIRETEKPPLYKLGRQYKKPGLCKKYKKYELWDTDLCEGEHFFVDGIFGPSTDLSKRFIWFELDNGERYKHAEELVQNIRDYFKQNFPGNLWMTSKCFYYNLDNNKNTGKDGNTAHQIWNYQWKHFINRKIQEYNNNDILGSVIGEDRIPSFWYTPDPSLWFQLLDQDRKDASSSSIYMRASDRAYRYFRSGDYLQSKCYQRHTRLESSSSKLGNTFPSRDKLPLPQPHTSNTKADPAALAQLQTRIDVLETKLSRVKQEENTKHLLEQVLERLDTL
jgi:hypothetical protein